MKHDEAVDMLKNSHLPQNMPQKWADLGCGNGTFTKALAQLLPAKSTIYAVDTNRSALAQIPDQFEEVKIEKINMDFTQSDLPFSGLNGILMANSIHYVRDKEIFIQQLIPLFQPNPKLLVVEYDTTRGNQWVPFPINFAELNHLFMKIGFLSIQKLSERPSLYQRGNLYSAIALPK